MSEIEEIMTGAEFLATREHLGLTSRWLADHLGVAERSVVRWGDDQSPVPPGVADEILALEERAWDRVHELEAEATATQHKGEEPVITVYRTNEAAAASGETGGYPAAWYRAIGIRVRERLASVRLVYSDED